MIRIKKADGTVVEFDNDEDFKKAVAQSIEDLGKPEWSKTLEGLVPALYSLAILGAANSIICKSLKESGLLNDKKVKDGRSKKRKQRKRKSVNSKRPNN